MGEVDKAVSPPRQPASPQLILTVGPEQKSTLVKSAIAIVGLAVLIGIVFLATKIIQPPPPKVIQIPVRVSPTPIPDLYTESSRSATANWKTYTNREYRFSFKYPSDFEPSFGSNIVVSVHTPTKEDFDPRLVFTCQEIFVFGIEFSEMSLYKDKQFYKVNVGDKEALRYDSEYGSGKDSCTTSSILIPDITDPRNRVLHIYLNRDSQQYQETFDQILSTFQFLDQEQNADNSKVCLQDNDCTLLQCSGCFNKEWVQTAPSDLPCTRYSGYSCKCVENECSETK